MLNFQCFFVGDCFKSTWKTKWIPKDNEGTRITSYFSYTVYMLI